MQGNKSAERILTLQISVNIQFSGATVCVREL